MCSDLRGLEQLNYVKSTIVRHIFWESQLRTYISRKSKLQNSVCNISSFQVTFESMSWFCKWIEEAGNWSWSDKVEQWDRFHQCLSALTGNPKHGNAISSPQQICTFCNCSEPSSKMDQKFATRYRWPSQSCSWSRSKMCRVFISLKISLQAGK